VPLERLALSPQCGFASTHEGTGSPPTISGGNSSSWRRPPGPCGTCRRSRDDRDGRAHRRGRADRWRPLGRLPALAVFLTASPSSSTGSTTS
jgi:hypothetical protein